MSQDVMVPHIQIPVASGKLSDKRKHDKGITDAGVAPSVIEEAEILHGSIKAGSVAQIVIAVIATIGLLYFLKFVIVTSVLALLLAFVLEPLVCHLRRIAIPRAIGAMVAVIMASVLVGGLGYFLYNQLDSFSSELPQYSARIRQSWERIQAPIIRLESNAQSATGPPEDARQAVPVRVQEAPISHFLFSNSESIGRILLAISFIPVLTYFMLTWKDHVHTATVQLFPEEHRMVAFRAIARISKMLRSFLVANLIVGLIGAASFTALFWFLGIANSYFIGVLCGFLSLIPSIGVLLALLPPIVGGAGTLHESGLLILVLGIVGIHVATIDFLYPKLVGTRVLLNPLAVILSLVFWAWIWGGVGLVLAIPIVAAAKIVCDHTDALKGVGVWLGT
jgi:predicted PurR-regulated permease PerM